MPAINVARTDTFEQQRQKINLIAQDVFDASTAIGEGVFSLDNGTIQSPALYFSNKNDLGLFKNSNDDLIFVSDETTILGLSDQSITFFKPAALQSNSIGNELGQSVVSIINPGSGYSSGTFANIALTGGTGTGAEASLVLSGFNGNVTNIGNGYLPGTYNSVTVTGGSGSGAQVSVIVEGIQGTIAGGSGYVDGDYFDVPLTGGSGSGARAQISVAGGEVASVNISDNGNFSYNNNDSLSASAANLGGSGGGFSYTITNNPFSIEYSNFTITNSGDNYIVGDSIGVSNADLGGQGSGFSFTVSSLGTLNSVTISNGGFGYTVGDLLSFNSNDLQTPFEYLVEVRASQFVKFDAPYPQTGFNTGGQATIGAETRNIFRTYTSGSDILGIIVDVSTDGNFTNPVGETITSGGGSATVNSTLEANMYYYSADSGVNYVAAADLTLEQGRKYEFTSANFESHPPAFSTRADGIHGSPAGIAYDGDEVSFGQTSITITPNSTTPSPLYLYCTLHPNMNGDDGFEGTTTISSTVYSAPGSGASIRVDSVIDTDVFSVDISGNVVANSINCESTINAEDIVLSGGISATGDLTLSANITVDRKLNVDKSSRIGDTLGVEQNLTVAQTFEAGTGTISTSQQSSSVTGTLSTFLTEVEEGDQLYDVAHNFIGIVDSVNTNLEISLKEPSRLDLITESYRISKNPTLFVDNFTKRIGVKNTLPEYDLDVKGSFKTLNNSVIGDDPESKVTIGSEDLISSLGSGEKLHVDGSTKVNGFIQLSSLNNVSNPSVRFDGNSKFGISSNSNNNTISITGSSGELQRYAFDETNLFRDLKLTNKTISTFIKTSGSGYTNGSYTNVPLEGGTGSGILVDIDVAFDVDVPTPGEGYSAAVYPNVLITGGAGTGAIAEVEISSGNVANNISISNGGAGYESSPTVVFTGDGSGAFGLAQLDSTGTLKSIVVDASGSNYTTATIEVGTVWSPSNLVNVGEQYYYGSNLYTVTVQGTTDATNPPTHSSGLVFNGTAELEYVGVVATASATIGIQVGIDFGQITGINVDTLGSGYTSNPSITIVGDGSGARASSILQYGVASVKVLNGGSGYTSAPVVSFNGGNPTSSAVATASITNNGISSIKIVDSGDNNYVIGDSLGLDVSSMVNALGQTSNSPSTPASLVVSALGSVSNLVINDNGLGYESGDILTIPSSNQQLSSGSGFQVEITALEESSTISLTVDTGLVESIGFKAGNSGINVNDSLSITDSTISSLNSGDVTFGLVSTSLLNIQGNGGIKLPVGTNTNRPSASTLGIIRYNSETQQYEGSNGSDFISLGGVRDVDGNTYIIAERVVGANDNTLYFYNDATNSARFFRNSVELVTSNTIRSVNTDGKTLWESGITVAQNELIYTDNSIYEITNSGGTTGSAAPTHTSGVANDDEGIEYTYVSTVFQPLTFKASNISFDATLSFGTIDVYTFNSISSIFESSVNDIQFAFGDFSGTPNTLLSLTNQGKLALNKSFDTQNAVNNLEILDYTGKFLELDDVIIKTQDIPLQKGGTESGNFVIYDPTEAKSSKIVVTAENTTTNDIHTTEIQIIVKGTDIFTTEYSSLNTGQEQFTYSISFTPGGEVQIQYILDSALAAGDAVIITSSTTTIKK